MEALPPHIRAEDEVYFRQQPLAPMSFRARWILGIKVLIAAQLVWLPASLVLGVSENFGERFPASLTIAGLVCCALFGPFWAAGLFRGWVASSAAQRLIGEVLEPSDVRATSSSQELAPGSEKDSK